MKYKKIIITAVAIVLIFILIGGGSFAYHKYSSNKEAVTLAKEGKDLKGEYSDAEKYYEKAKELNENNDEYSHMLMLNEIWGVLTEQLPEHQMDALTDDELAWIAEKEQNGDQIKSNKDGANMNFVMQTYYEIFADMTRDRCYILVNMYMQ